MTRPYHVLLLTLATTVSYGAVVNWDLQGVTFSDGGTASGTFVYEATTQSILFWNIHTYPGSAFSGFAYEPSTSQALTNYNGCSIDFVATRSTSIFLCLNPSSALSAGATPELVTGSLESYPGGRRLIVSGSLSDPPPGGGDAIPEPATAFLVVPVLVAALRVARRRPA